MDGWMLADVGLAAELEDLQEISEDGSKDPVASSTATALAAIFIDPIPVASSATLPATLLPLVTRQNLKLGSFVAGNHKTKLPSKRKCLKRMQGKCKKILFPTT